MFKVIVLISLIVSIVTYGCSKNFKQKIYVDSNILIEKKVEECFFRNVRRVYIKETDSLISSGLIPVKSCYCYVYDDNINMVLKGSVDYQINKVFRINLDNYNIDTYFFNTESQIITREIPYNLKEIRINKMTFNPYDTIRATLKIFGGETDPVYDIIDVTEGNVVCVVRNTPFR